MVLAALSMGFSLSDLESLTLNDLLIYTAINAENRSRKRKAKAYRPATQKDIEALKRM